MTSVLYTQGRDSSGTVLIIDDEPGVLQSYERMLRLEGYTVVTAENAEDGLREAMRHAPDVILLDLRMPIMDGVAFLRRLRAHEARPWTPVAIVTGHYLIDDSVIAELEALGAGLQFKPLWLEDLVAVVQDLIAVRAQRNTPQPHGTRSTRGA
jgi:two-component system response regulator PrrA